jgi:DNA-binding LacI/PurR family transcriptional regulator
MSQVELAHLAFQALMNQIEAGEGGAAKSQYDLTTSLVLRGSTALADFGAPAQS